jgi:hypothetical protein
MLYLLPCTETEAVALIVCGDFNGEAESGAVQFLEKGYVNETFLEDGEPVTQRRKVLLMSKPLIDVSSTVSRPPPNTLIVPELISLMVQGDAYENPMLSHNVIERLTRVYNRYATLQQEDGMVMQRCDVERWLTDINRQVGRGSEFREAARQMGWTDPCTATNDDDNEEGTNTGSKEKATIELPMDGVLTLDGFLKVYQAELRQGKFWGIAHDLVVMGEALPEVGVYQARFDRMYCTSAVQPTAVLDFLCSRPCPNEVEPSDHLPIAAVFTLRK